MDDRKCLEEEDKAIKEMRQLLKYKDDPEQAQALADEILLTFLQRTGAIRLVGYYKAARKTIGFWYA